MTKKSIGAFGSVVLSLVGAEIKCKSGKATLVLSPGHAPEGSIG